MPEEFNAPDVYTLSWRQRVVFCLCLIAGFSYVAWLESGEPADHWQIILVGALIVPVLVPRLTLGEDGVRMTICGMPWLRLTPWHLITRLELNYASNKIIITMRSGRRRSFYPAWVFTSTIELLDRMSDRRLHHLGRMCRNCGYNLIGNTTGQCPECGERCFITTTKPG